MLLFKQQNFKEKLKSYVSKAIKNRITSQDEYHKFYQPNTELEIVSMCKIEIQ